MSDPVTERISREDVLRMATDIIAAYVGRNQLGGSHLPELINTVFGALSGLNRTGSGEVARAPAVSVRRSITPDFIICLEDGKKLKMLKRYLRTNYSLTPDQYRAKWKLPHDYPMVAPNYAKQRSEFAKNIGLGTASSRRS